MNRSQQNRLILVAIVLATHVPVWCQSYSFERVASPTPSDGLNSPTFINDAGLCVSTGAGYVHIYGLGVANQTIASPLPHPGFPPTFIFSSKFRALSINNNSPAQVLVCHDLTEAVIGPPIPPSTNASTTWTRNWDHYSFGAGPQSSLPLSQQSVGLPQAGAECISFSSGDINDSGLAIYSVLEHSATSSSTYLLAGYGSPLSVMSCWPCGSEAFPELANNNRYVLRDNIGQILIVNYPNPTPEVVAGPSNGFISVEPMPGIALDGSAIAWIGDRGQGEGVFVAVRHNDVWTTRAVSTEGDPTLVGLGNIGRVAIHSKFTAQNTQELRVIFGATEQGTGPASVSAQTIRAVKARVSYGSAQPEFFVEEPSVILKGGDILGDTSVLGSFRMSQSPNTNGQLVIQCFGVYPLGFGAITLVATPDSIEILDFADPSFVDESGNPRRSLSAYQASGVPRLGACADGVSRLVLRLPTLSAGHVHFQIIDSSTLGGSGELQDVLGTSAGEMVSVTTAPNGAGHHAVCLWTPPIDFVRPGNSVDYSAESRKIKIKATLFPTTGGPQLITYKDIELRRPPVVLCHGLWSGPETWNDFVSVTSDPRFLTIKANYSHSNSASFSSNSKVCRVWTSIARSQMRKRGIACAQADWIGHSMGGVLPRVGLADAGDYYRGDNLFAGDVHKLISINSPHAGSRIASIGLALLNTPSSDSTLIARLMRNAGYPIDSGAIADLAQESGAIARLGRMGIPAHSITGNGGSHILSSAGNSMQIAIQIVPPNWKPLFLMLRYFGVAAVDQIYEGQDHDFLVYVNSQSGALPIGAVSSMSGASTHHLAVTSNNTVGAIVADRLSAPTRGLMFSETFPPATYNPPTVLAEGGAPVSNGGLSLQLANQAAVVIAGETITVTALGTNGFTPSIVNFIFPDGNIVADELAPFSATWLVPLHLIGTVSVDALSLGASGGGLAAPSSPMSIAIGTNAVPTALSLSPGEVTFNNFGDALQLAAYVLYSDGVERGGRYLPPGLSFLSSDNSVAYVDSNGIVSAVGNGVSEVTAVLGSIQGSVVVTVDMAAVSFFGEGTPGSGGLIPLLSTGGGEPVLGNISFNISISRALGGACGFLGLSTRRATSFIPEAQATLYIATDVTSIAVPIEAIGNGPGEGQVCIPIPVPQDPRLLGLSIYSQAVICDPMGYASISLTNAVKLTVLP